MAKSRRSKKQQLLKDYEKLLQEERAEEKRLQREEEERWLQELEYERYLYEQEMEKRKEEREQREIDAMNYDFMHAWPDIDLDLYF